MVIYWKTNDRSIIESIRKRWNIPAHTSLNGETDIGREVPKGLDIMVDFGYIELRNK